MEQEINIDYNKEIQATHCFVYKSKRYPFNMEFFKYFSQYFQTHSHLYINTIEIDFFDLEDKISLNENAINDFINFCYAKKITIKKENALSIHILAKKFIVPSLIEATQNFISTHQKDLVIELLILNQVNQNDDEIISEDYEEMFSKDLLNYINDDRLFFKMIKLIQKSNTTKTFVTSYLNVLIILGVQRQFYFQFFHQKVSATIFLLGFTMNFQKYSTFIF